MPRIRAHRILEFKRAITLAFGKDPGADVLAAAGATQSEIVDQLAEAWRQEQLAKPPGRIIE